MGQSAIRKSVKSSEYAKPERVAPRPGSQFSGVPRHATELMPDMNIPTVRLGEPILWYADGHKNNTPHNALVAKIDTNTIAIDLITSTGFKRIPTVCYIEDARLQLGGMRKHGGWALGAIGIKFEEMNDKIKSQEEKIAAMGDLLDALTKEVEELIAKK
jgi:hypothetical protein